MFPLPVPHVSAVRRRAGPIACAVLGLALMPGSTTLAADLTQIQKAGVLKLAFSTNAQALIAQDGGGIHGFATELTALIASQMKVRAASWQRASTPQALIKGLEAGSYDALFDTSLPRPLGGVNLSKPLACDGGVILSRPGGPTYEEDLKGKRVAVVTGSPYYYYVRNLPFDKKISVFSEDSQALVGFLSGSIDALVLNRFDALKILKRTGSKQFQVSPLLWSEDLDLVVTQSDNKEIISAIDAALKALMADGTYAKLSLKYFDQDVRCVR